MMPVKYKSNAEKVIGLLKKARNNGMIAAAALLQKAVRQGLQGGYTSGAFANNWNVAHVFVGNLIQRTNGTEIHVFTDLKYPLYWELGHVNLFIDGRIYVGGSKRESPIRRKEVWSPAFHDSHQEQMDEFGDAFRRVMEKAPRGKSL